MVTNPQERPRISWVLDQVQSLRGSDGTDVDTNRVWCFHSDFMPVFLWTFWTMHSLFRTKITSLANICSPLPQCAQHALVTRASLLANLKFYIKIIWWFWGKIWAGHVPELCHAHHTGEGKDSVHYNGSGITGTGDVSSNCLFSCTFLGGQKLFMTVSVECCRDDVKT